MLRQSSISRRDFLLRGSIALTCGAALSRYAALAETATQEHVEVETTYGRIRGLKSKDLQTFKGIPYGGPVSGAHRFKAAPPLQPWTGVRDALKGGAPSLQTPLRPYFGISEALPAEDCLFLNVWTPAADGQKRPVMFYSHGGGFSVGSGSAPYQDGGVLARTWDVVVVETNHRLGLMGFLYLGDLAGEEYATSGNQGLLDICDGLKWVHGNIAALWRRSRQCDDLWRERRRRQNLLPLCHAGGSSLLQQSVHRERSGHPHDAARYGDRNHHDGAEGARAGKDRLAEAARGARRQASRYSGCFGQAPGRSIDNERWTQGDRRRRTSRRLWAGGGWHAFCRIIRSIPKRRQSRKTSRSMVGYNRDETIFFFMESHNTDVFNLTEASLKERLQKEFGDHADEVYIAYHKSRPEASPTDLYIAISTARMIGFGSVTIAERKFAQHGAPVYSYIFTYESERIVPGTQHKVGAAHALEIAYKFDLIEPTDKPSTGDPAQTATRTMMDTGPASVKTAENMSQMWSTFARTGKPGAKGQPEWPAYDTTRRATMMINAECKVVDDPFRLEREFWERMEP